VKLNWLEEQKKKRERQRKKGEKLLFGRLSENAKAGSNFF
jgi:hypothetical protein